MFLKIKMSTPKNTDEEDYIDMELITTSISSPSKNTEFEFQLIPSFSYSHQKQADELFYKGKLLPLMPLHEITNLPFPEITKLPFPEPLNHPSLPLMMVGPSESCRVSCDRDYYNAFPDFSGELSRIPAKIPAQRKLGLGRKIRASSAYLKSLFGRIGKKGSFGPIEDNGQNNIHRRSFSDTIRRHTPAKCLSSSSSESCSSSSSFSLRSNGQYEQSFARRDSSASEIEASIDAAIDHCKKSMQIFRAINSVEEDDKSVAARSL